MHVFKKKKKCIFKMHVKMQVKMHVKMFFLNACKKMHFQFYGNLFILKTQIDELDFFLDLFRKF